MGWAVTIGRIAGTAVRIHVTFLLYLAWIAYANWEEGGAADALDATLFISLLFLCVVAHEFGHIFAARRYGIATPDVTLLPIGGVARLERIPDDPKQELVVALAGPAVNVVIALVLAAVVGAPDAAHFGALEDPRVAMAQRVLQANIILVIFNMIPAFPMDGGRVLRALLAMKWPRLRATQIAARIGQGLAFAMMLIGFMGQPMLFVLALFVWLSAAQESQMEALRAGSGLVVGDAVERDVVALAEGATLDDGARALMAGAQGLFPLLDRDGRPLNAMTRAALLDAVNRGERAALLGWGAFAAPTIRADAPLEHAFAALGSEEALAVDSFGRFLGLVTRRHAADMLMRRGGAPWRG